jgi:hypothetical protein
MKGDWDEARAGLRMTAEKTCVCYHRLSLGPNREWVVPRQSYSERFLVIPEPRPTSPAAAEQKSVYSADPKFRS